MIINAKALRNKETLTENISNAHPGYYIWWAEREELDSLLKGLNVDFKAIESFIKKKENLYAIYVGITVNGSIRSRINWHVNDKHSAARVRNKTLSTLRQSISSIIVNDQYDKEATDSFIDKLFVEYFYSDNKIKSNEARKEITAIEKDMMNGDLFILNIKDNNHDKATDIKRKLKELRKVSR